MAQTSMLLKNGALLLTRLGRQKMRSLADAFDDDWGRGVRERFRPEDRPECLRAALVVEAAALAVHEILARQPRPPGGPVVYLSDDGVAVRAGATHFSVHMSHLAERIMVHARVGRGSAVMLWRVIADLVDAGDIALPGLVRKTALFPER